MKGAHLLIRQKHFNHFKFSLRYILSLNGILPYGYKFEEQTSWRIEFRYGSRAGRRDVMEKLNEGLRRRNAAVRKFVVCFIREKLLSVWKTSVFDLECHWNFFSLFVLYDKLAHIVHEIFIRQGIIFINENGNVIT